MKNRINSEYFHPRSFVGNNIEYRIACATYLSKFKESQSYILNQLAFNPYHDFSKDGKEILLFNFDVFFDYLCEIEQYFLVEQEKVSFSGLENLFNLRISYIELTLNETSEIDNGYYFYYLEITRPIFDHLLSEIEEINNLDLPMSSKFGMISEKILKKLNHILYIIQELDILIKSEKTPIINLDLVSCEFLDNRQFIFNRFEIYMGIREIKEIIIKDYLDFQTPFENTVFHNYLEEENIKYKLV